MAALGSLWAIPASRYLAIIRRGLLSRAARSYRSLTVIDAAAQPLLSRASPLLRRSSVCWIRGMLFYFDTKMHDSDSYAGLVINEMLRIT